MPEISVIVINWNTCELLASCLRSIDNTAKDLDLDVIVVDNGSTDNSREMLRSDFPSVRVIENQENLGFSRANNQAARATQSELIYLFNSDAELLPGSLNNMVELIKSQPKAGIVGSHLVNPDGTFQASHTPFPSLWQEFLILTGLGRAFFGRWYPSRGPEVEKGPQLVQHVEGASLLCRRDVYLSLGGLDETYFMYAEEVDLCYTCIKAGWQVWYHPEGRVLHHGGGSSRGRRTAREGDLYTSQVLFFKKHRGPFAAFILKTMIYALTLVKFIIHNLLSLVTRGRRGRKVISPKDLHLKLKRV